MSSTYTPFVFLYSYDLVRGRTAAIMSLCVRKSHHVEPIQRQGRTTGVPCSTTMDAKQYHLRRCSACTIGDGYYSAECTYTVLQKDDEPQNAHLCRGRAECSPGGAGQHRLSYLPSYSLWTRAYSVTRHDLCQAETSARMPGVGFSITCRRILLLSIKTGLLTTSEQPQWRLRLRSSCNLQNTLFRLVLYAYLSSEDTPR
jgi:hypothetical protein